MIALILAWTALCMLWAYWRGWVHGSQHERLKRIREDREANAPGAAGPHQ